MRKETLTLLGLSAIALLLASPLALSLQPVQAQTLMTFKTLSPAEGQLPCCPEQTPATMTFFAQGTASSSYNQTVKITNGIL